MLQFLVATCLLAQHGPDPLAQAFRNPPASAKPHTWWHWMDGNITREGITADLEAMRTAGIGGAHIFDVGQGVPSGPIAYNTPAWRDLMTFAIAEGKRLGLEMTMHNCAGWSSSGGPWVQPEDAMKRITASTIAVTGTNLATTAVPTPPSVGGFYRDIAVFVLSGDIEPGAIGSLTGLGPNPGPIERLDWPSAQVVEVLAPEKIRADGTLDVRLAPGSYTLLRIGETLTGAQNVASRDSGRGYEVDKLSKTSLDRFLAGGIDPLLAQVSPRSGRQGLTTVLVDSYETGYNNWTPAMLDEFRKRRGYDATLYLPALAGFVVGNERRTLGFLFDYRRTLAELWAEHYSGHFATRLREKGLDLAIEPYGNGNFDPFTYAKPAGLIMGEYWVGDSTINASVKHASSVAHVYGHSVVGAEALTATPDQAGWRNQPRQWKPFADLAMTLGINRIIYHRFAHQPWKDGVLPGMTMGPWGSHVDRGNTIWPYMPAWNLYISRCQQMLQSGKFVGDILLFPGEDAPQSYAGEGQKLPEVPDGYDFDYCGLDPLMTLQVRQGRLVLPNGASYALLALPIGTTMTLPLARKIRELVEAGAVVVGPKPTRTPSLAEASKGGDAVLADIADDLWGLTSTVSGRRKVGKGQIFWGPSLGAVLAAVPVAPDFQADRGLVRAIHRRVAEDEVFFVASSEPYPRTVNCRFRVGSGNKRVQFWNPENGQIMDAPVWQNLSQGRIVVPIRLESNGSIFVVVRPADRQVPHAVRVESAGFEATGTAPKPQLTILKAIYGDQASGKVVDVTRFVAGAAGPHSVRVRASNSAMGGDPAVNIVKTLTVTYRLGEETHTVTLRENESFSIGDLPEEGTPPDFEIVGNEVRFWRPGRLHVLQSDRRSLSKSVRGELHAIPVDGKWTLTFPSGWDAPAEIEVDKLESWSMNADPGIRYFSGTANYTHPLNVPASMVGPSTRVILDLGDVREMCRVKLNGRLVSTLWKPPFRVDITPFVRVGTNDLQVEVTNLWVNRLIGDEQFPDDMGWSGDRLKGWPDWFQQGLPRPEPRRKTFTTWRHNFKDTPLLPSGLLGPVVLRPVRTMPLSQ